MQSSDVETRWRAWERQESRYAWRGLSEGSIMGFSEVLHVKHLAQGLTQRGPSEGLGPGREQKRQPASRSQHPPTCGRTCVAGSLASFLRRTWSGLGTVRTKGTSEPFSPWTWHLAPSLQSCSEGAGRGMSAALRGAREMWLCGIILSRKVGRLEVFQAHREAQ